ncbi:hypothetical protein BKA69DRAFT_1038100 [Paraphysoderma sedebokerense]|nr:hypothetical protein BKA69DRAFT_1038100 [Paraphysoderma sedebokerense]
MKHVHSRSAAIDDVLHFIGDELLDQTVSFASTSIQPGEDIILLDFTKLRKDYVLQKEVPVESKCLSPEPSVVPEEKQSIYETKDLLSHLRRDLHIDDTRQLLTFKYCIENNFLQPSDTVIFDGTGGVTIGQVVRTDEGVCIRCECQKEHPSFSSFIQHVVGESAISGSHLRTRLRVQVHLSATEETLSWLSFRQTVLGKDGQIAITPNIDSSVAQTSNVVKTFRQSLGETTLKKIYDSEELCDAFGGIGGLDKELDGPFYEFERPNDLTDSLLMEWGFDNYAHYRLWRKAMSH